MVGQKGGRVREIPCWSLQRVFERDKGGKSQRAEQGEKSFLKLTGENAGTQQEEEVSLRHGKSHRGAELQCAESPVGATFLL